MWQYQPMMNRKKRLTNKIRKMKIQNGTLYWNTKTGRVERLNSIDSCAGEGWTYHHDEVLEKVKLVDLDVADLGQVNNYLGRY